MLDDREEEAYKLTVKQRALVGRLVVEELEELLVHTVGKISEVQSALDEEGNVFTDQEEASLAVGLLSHVVALGGILHRGSRKAT